MTSPGGEVCWQQWRDCGIFDDRGGIVEYQAVGHDITDRKHAEDLRHNLAHASRLAVMGEFTAMIAHELNQPLSAVLTNADAAALLLKEQDVALDQIREILADIRSDNLRARETIGRIRALMTKRTIEMQELDLNKVVSDVLHVAGGDALRRRVQVHTTFDPALPAVYADDVHVQQVLLNLILNGMEAMNGNTESERHLFVTTTSNGNGLAEVVVKDVGHGIPPDILARIFESFFTTKRDGMGLGLSLSRSIIQMHSGQMWAENNPDQRGASFHFTLPSTATSASGWEAGLETLHHPAGVNHSKAPPERTI